MTTATTSTRTAQEKIIHSLQTELPCSFVRLQKFADLTFTSPELQQFDGQKVLLDPSIDFLSAKQRKPPKADENYLTMMIECRSPIDNTLVVECCTPQTCAGGQNQACTTCKNQRQSGVYISNENFQNKLFHARRKETNEDTVVIDNNIDIKLRIVCANEHLGLKGFVFFVELVDKNGVAKFRGIFTASVGPSQHGSVTSTCSIPLIAV